MFRPLPPLRDDQALAALEPRGEFIRADGDFAGIDDFGVIQTVGEVTPRPVTTRSILAQVRAGDLGHVPEHSPLQEHVPLQ